VPWRKVRFKGKLVLARCEADGSLRAEGGRVEIRYRAGDARAYRAGLRNLQAEAEAEAAVEILPDDTCPPAREAAAGGTAARRSSSGRPRSGPAGASGATKSASGTPSPPPPPDGAVMLYTDGACSGNPGPAGVGVVLIDGSRRRELSAYLGEATNNVAELTAIAMGLDAVARDGHCQRPVRLYTDSKYSIGVLVQGWKAKKNVELIVALRQRLEAFEDLHLHHVRGHAGHPLNERADELAVEAVRGQRSVDWVDI